jgi:hypothetical protein
LTGEHVCPRCVAGDCDDHHRQVANRPGAGEPTRNTRSDTSRSSVHWARLWLGAILLLAAVAGLMLALDTGSRADASSATSVPSVPNLANCTAAWNNGASAVVRAILVGSAASQRFQATIGTYIGPSASVTRSRVIGPTTLSTTVTVTNNACVIRSGSVIVVQQRDGSWLPATAVITNNFSGVHGVASIAIADMNAYVTPLTPKTPLSQTAGLVTPMAGAESVSFPAREIHWVQ